MKLLEFTAPTAAALTAMGVIFLLRVVGVSISTIRMLVMMRGRKFAAVALGFFEVLVYVLAIGQVMTDHSNVWSVLGYCAGFCVGTLTGMMLDERMVRGHAAVRVISRTAGKTVLDALHAAGHGATLETGVGRDGPVSIIHAIVMRRDVPALCDLVHTTDPASFLTVEDARTVLRGYLRAGQREK